jgi:hypothetical protein
MKNLITTIALLLPLCILSQGTILIEDFLYDEGIESTFTVMYMPDNTLEEVVFLEEAESKYIMSRTNWHFHYSSDGSRMLKLRVRDLGTYQITQWSGGQEVQLSTIQID